MKRQIDGFLKILGLHRLKIDIDALRKDIAPFDEENWIKIGTLTKNEKRLYAVADWCGKNGDRLSNESGIIEFCSEELRETLEINCDHKDDNSVKLKALELMCSSYLNYLLHERLYISMMIPLLVFDDFSVCYYVPSTVRPVPGKWVIPEFAKN